jgi:alpha-galactosidase/6-phospho-beta-glucosidase family protein
MSSINTIKVEEINTTIVKSKNIYDTTLEGIKEKVSLITIRPSTLYLIIKYVMEEVEKTPIKGPEQKEMALKLIKALIIDLTENEDEEVLLNLLNDGTIGNLMDLIVDVSKGKININKISKVSIGCFKRCYPYLCKSKK